MMKRIRLGRRLGVAVTLSLVFLLAFALPTLAYLYSAPLTITESSGTSYSAIGVNCSADISWLIANGFITTSTALDTRVETLGGVEQIHMMAEDKIMLFVPSLPAYGQLNWFFTTGNTALSSFAVIVGYGGNVTVEDDPVLELGNNFSIVFECWVPASVTNERLVEKPGAISINVTSTAVSADVTATINVSPPVAVTSAGNSIGEHLIEVWADGSYLFIDVT